MADFWDTATKAASTPGDWAVLLGAGAAGCVVDGVLTIHGFFSPLTVGALSATSALSAKKGWEAGRKAKHDRKAAQKEIKKVKAATERAQTLQKHFEGKQYAEGAQVLSEQLELRKLDLIDDATLHATINTTLAEFEAWVKKNATPAQQVKTGPPAQAPVRPTP